MRKHILPKTFRRLNRFGPSISSERINVLDDLYHSETYDEILMKMAISNISRLTYADICWLAFTEAYHLAYWDTKQRWKAFKTLIDKDCHCKRIIASARFSTFCQKIIDELNRHNDLELKNGQVFTSVRIMTPGHKLLLKTWMKLLEKSIQALKNRKENR